MNTHTERLAEDLAQVRLLANLVDDDEDKSAMVAGIIGNCSDNLLRARDCELAFITFDALNEYQQAFMSQHGFDGFTPFTPPPCPEADEIIAEAAHLRALLESAVSRVKVSDVRRLANLLIKNERRLWKVRLDAGVYLTADALEKLQQAWSTEWLATIDRSDADAWADRVQRILGEAANDDFTSAVVQAMVE